MSRLWLIRPSTQQIPHNAVMFFVCLSCLAFSCKGLSNACFFKKKNVPFLNTTNITTCDEIHLQIFSMPELHEKEPGVHEKGGAIGPYI